MRIRGTTTNPGAGKSAHYSDEWYTPPEIPAAVGPFDLDPCAGPMSHAARNIRRPDCGLAAEWSGKVWLNPPYSSVHEWLDKLIAHGDGIALVNARPETLWFQRAVLKATAVLWLRGRVDFQRPDRVATHPPVGSVLVAFGEHNADALHRAELRGAFMRVVGRAAAADGVLRKPRARNGAVPQISVLNNPPSSNT
ncbi:MAG: hypothetical protein EBR82_43935, partial [Caulobacteraceae bacterium]|nr:hypothetical protein [Caulobacteraceae bacterium]